MKKFNLFLLGFVLLANSVNAQSAKDIFSSISIFPTEKEVSAQLKTNKPFEKILKGLDDNINKYEKTIDNEGEATSEEATNRLKELGVDENASEESMLSNMNISKADLEALDNMDDNNPAKIAMAMKIAQQYNNSNFAQQSKKQSLAMANRMQGLPENFTGGEISEAQANEMEKRGELITKVSEYNMEMMTTYSPIIRECESKISEFESDYDPEKECKALCEKLSNLKQDETDYNNHTATLAAINKYNREYHEIECQIAAKKLNHMLDILRSSYNKLKPNQNKLITMDDSMVQLNKNMKNGMENVTEVKNMLIEFAKMYKAVLEENTPAPAVQYKTWAEYEQKGMN